ncbi:hypothetical protein EI94DRAFT_1698991 [Lactarius quietus]|nr:hypothetical protein EI94DRAFT_1698991 [Lactarius quietus]
MQTRGNQKSEKTSREAAAYRRPQAQAVFTMGAIAQNPEVLPRQTMKEKLTPEAMARSEAEGIKLLAGEEKRFEAINDELHAMRVMDQIAKQQRVMDKAARAAAIAFSPKSTAWSSSENGKITQAAPAVASAIIPTEEPVLPPKSTIPHNSNILSNGENAPSPNTEFGPLPDEGGPGVSVQHSSTTSPTPCYPPSVHTVKSIKATPSSASAVPSFPTFVSQERNPLDDKQDGHTGEGKDDQTQNTTAALPAEASAEPTPMLDHSSSAGGGANITSTTSMSSLGTPADEAQVSTLDDWVGSFKLTKSQKKKMREKARMRAAQKGEKNKLCAPSGATSNSGHNSVVQESEPVADSLPCQCSLCQRNSK